MKTLARGSVGFSALTKILTLLALVGSTFSLMAQPVTQLKVMSFNILWGQQKGQATPTANAIRQSGADIVGMQECPADAAKLIAQELGFHHYGVDGASIVSRYPIVTNHGSGRSSGITIQLAPGQRAHLFNCHLTAYPYGPYDIKKGNAQKDVLKQEEEVRGVQLNALLKVMQPFIAGGEPCFLTGDFNAPSHLDYADYPWPTSLACEKATLVDSYRELHPQNRKFPKQFAFDEPGITWTPKTHLEPEGIFDRIDFVHYSPGDGAKPTTAQEIDERNGFNPWPSDHRAVLTTFTLTPKK